MRFLVRTYESIQDISPMLIKKDSPWRESLSLDIKLMITLRHLASGMSYVDLVLEFCVANNTINKIVREVCNAIVLTYNEQYLECPNTSEEWEMVAHGFWTRRNMPNCCGAIDGKHIAIKKKKRVNPCTSIISNYFLLCWWLW